MGKLVFAMMQSLDGYVDHLQLGPPSPALSDHFLKHVRGLSGCLYGRSMYEVMRYWDDDSNVQNAEDRAFATAWRSKPKWVVSRSTNSVGPNATLVDGDLAAFVRELKRKVDAEIDVAGPDLAGTLTELGLIDEYRLYLRPLVLGRGKPYFVGARPPLRLVATDAFDGDTVRLTYVPV